MKPKILPILLILMILSNLINAQVTLTKFTVDGFILDSTNNLPLSGVNIKVINSNNVVINTKSTNKGGYFSLNNLNIGKYEISFSYIGYIIARANINIKSTDPQILHLKQILAVPNLDHLKEIKIVSSNPILTRQIDRITYNVQLDPEVRTQSIFEMMRKIPLITIDANDKIQLKGNSDFKILINEKLSPMSGNNVSSLLKTMQSANISKVEVYTIPPAKYDSEGQGGIINIITSKRLEDGYNGSISGNYSKLIKAFGESLNIRNNKLWFSMDGGYSHEILPNSVSNLERMVQTPVSVDLSKTGITNYRGNNTYLSSLMSYEIDSLKLISLSTFLNKSNNSIQNNSFYAQSTPNQSYNLSNNNNVGTRGISLNLDFQMASKRHKDRILVFSYRFSNSDNSTMNESNFNKQHNFIGDNLLQNNYYGLKENSVQVDYIQPFKLMIVEGGGKVYFKI